MNILYNGSYLGREGLCIAGREIIKQLDKGHDIKIDSEYSPKISGYWEKFFKDFKDKKPEQAYIMNGHVTYLPEIAKKHKNIISICIFEAKLPDEWVKSLNIPEVKEIWTISEFGKELIVKSGVRKPVKVVYLGIDKRFTKMGVNMFPKDKSFKFLNISAPHGLGKKDRKGLDILIKAFKEEFKDDLAVTLILKVNSIYADQLNRKLGKTFDIYDYIKTLLPKGVNPNNITILPDYMTTEQLNFLYNSIHCGVFPSRGECLGLPQLELASIGRPVITSDYSATNEFSDSRLRAKITGMEPLDYDMPPYNQNLFAEIDIKHLRKLMRQVYEKWDYEYKMSEEFAKSLSKFTWDNTGKRMNELLTHINHSGT